MVSWLIGLAIVFIIIAFLAWVFGARGVAGFSMDIAKFLIVIFVVLFIIALLAGAVFV